MATTMPGPPGPVRSPAAGPGGPGAAQRAQPFILPDFYLPYPPRLNPHLEGAHLHSGRYTEPETPPRRPPGAPMLSSETWILLRAGAACAILAIIVAVIIKDRGGEPEDVTIGFLGPSLAAIYLLVLAVSLATEWQTIGDAGQAVTSEASTIRELYWTAAGFTPPQRAFLQTHVRAYATTVVNHDWPQMRKGVLDDTSERMLSTINSYVLKINPKDAAATNAQLQASTLLGTLFTLHDERAVDAAARMPQGLIAGVIATSLVVASFPFACGIGTRRSVALAAVQAAMVGIGIVVVFQLNHVYSGPLAVSPAPIQATVQLISAH